MSDTELHSARFGEMRARDVFRLSRHGAAQRMRNAKLLEVEGIGI